MKNITMGSTRQDKITKQYSHAWLGFMAIKSIEQVNIAVLSDAIDSIAKVYFRICIKSGRKGKENIKIK